MKKEVVFAIVLGIVVGLIITFGIYTANNALQKKAQRESTSTDSTQQTEDGKPVPTTITKIFSPEDGAIVDKNTIQLSGATFPNATIVIFVDDAEQVTTADAKGNFVAELELTGGSNVITTIATDTSGKQETDQRVVVFSTASLDESPTATAAASPKPSASPRATVKPRATPGVTP